jgi:IgA Peptidase M64
MAILASCKKEEAPVSLRENAVQKQHLVAAGTPIVVDVLGQGFSDENELERFVKDTYEPINTRLPFNDFSGALLFDSHLVSASALTVTPIADVTKCYFTFGNDFKQQLATAQTVSPNARLTIVVLKLGDNSGIGACAMSNDLIVTSELVDVDGLAHELGHALAGLKDETATSGMFVKDPTKSHKEPNCSDDDLSPPWEFRDATGTKVHPLAGCEGFNSGLFHPSNDCRMASPYSDFCCVCTQHMLRHLNDLLGTKVTAKLPCDIVGPVPTPAVAVPTKGRFIAAEFGPGAAAPIVSDATTVLYRSPLVSGDDFASIVVGQQVIATASLPDPPNIARAYPPGHTIDRKVEAPLPARIKFFVPGNPPEGPMSAAVINLAGFVGTRRLDEMKQPLTNVFILGIPP